MCAKSLHSQRFRHGRSLEPCTADYASSAWRTAVHGDNARGSSNLASNASHRPGNRRDEDAPLARMPGVLWGAGTQELRIDRPIWAAGGDEGRDAGGDAASNAAIRGHFAGEPAHTAIWLLNAGVRIWLAGARSRLARDRVHGKPSILTPRGKNWTRFAQRTLRSRPATIRERQRSRHRESLPVQTLSARSSRRRPGRRIDPR